MNIWFIFVCVRKTELSENNHRPAINQWPINFVTHGFNEYTSPPWTGIQMQDSEDIGKDCISKSKSKYPQAPRCFLLLIVITIPVYIHSHHTQQFMYHSVDGYPDICCHVQIYGIIMESSKCTISISVTFFYLMLSIKHYCMFIFVIVFFVVIYFLFYCFVFFYNCK